MVEKVVRRDGFRCLMCGERPTSEERKIRYDEKDVIQWLEELKERGIAKTYWRDYETEQLRTDGAFVYRYLRYDNHKLQADHIMPIALGGDEWDMKNIQTLCEECHKKKTAQDSKRIAEQRRIEEKLRAGQQQLPFR